MNHLKGVMKATKKDGTIYYRSSITYRSKHISLGSFDNASDCHKAYLEADALLKDLSQTIEHYFVSVLSFEKAVSLLNFRDNGLYSANPIYMYKRYFRYFLDKDEFLTFDIDDLFYYAKHKIMRRGNRLFVADYGMQIGILSRYGIQSYAVPGKDYIFKNGDATDYRYANIEVINSYHGVTIVANKTRVTYKAYVHVNGNLLIGTYDNAISAAIAYNKAVDILKSKGLNKNYNINYIEDLSGQAYAGIYSEIQVSKAIQNFSI